MCKRKRTPDDGDDDLHARLDGERVSLSKFLPAHGNVLPTFTLARTPLPPSVAQQLLPGLAQLWPYARQDLSARVRAFDMCLLGVLTLFRARVKQITSYFPADTTPTALAVHVHHALAAVDPAQPVLVSFVLPQLLSVAERLTGVLSVLHGISHYDGGQCSPVFALITDGISYDVLRWDGVSLSRIETITIDHAIRGRFLQGISSVMDLVFSVLLTGYIDTLAGPVAIVNEAGPIPPSDIALALEYARSVHQSFVGVDMDNAYTSGRAGESALRALDSSLVLVPPL